jgi:hypothetical protein
MFFISWRGIGLLVPALWVFTTLICGVIASLLHVQVGHDAHPATFVGVGAGGVVTGVILFFVARSIEGPRVRASKTNPTARPATRYSAGAFYYIPVRYWAFIVPILATAFAGFALFGPPLKPSPGVTPTPAATSPAAPPPPATHP